MFGKSGYESYGRLSCFQLWSGIFKNVYIITLSRGWCQKWRKKPLLLLKPKIWRPRKWHWKVSTHTHTQHTHKDPHVPTFWGPKALLFCKQPKCPGKSTARRNKFDHWWPLCHYQVSSDHRVSHKENRRQHSCLRCRCQSQPILGQVGCEEALWHCCGQGQHLDRGQWREECIRSLAPDYNALNVADKIGITKLTPAATFKYKFFHYTHTKECLHDIEELPTLNVLYFMLSKKHTIFSSSEETCMISYSRIYKAP